MIRPINMLAFSDFETTGVEDHDLPIELALIITDSELREITRFHTFIIWDCFPRDWKEWSGEFKAGFKYHKIPFSTIKDQGKTPFEVRRDLKTFLSTVKTLQAGARRILMVSDNTWFERRMMEKLIPYNAFHGSQEYFHYKAFDPSMLYELHGAAIDADTGRKEHRAMDDCELMLSEIRQIRDWVAAR